MFRDIKVGERVYSLDYGWSVVESRVDGHGISTPIQLRSECEEKRTYWITTCGRLMRFSLNPTVFWRPPPEVSAVWVVTMPRLGWDCLIGVFDGACSLEHIQRAHPTEDYEIVRRVVEADAYEYIDD